MTQNNQEDCIELKNIFAECYGVRRHELMTELLQDAITYLPLIKKTLDIAVAEQGYCEWITKSGYPEKTGNSYGDILKIYRKFSDYDKFDESFLMVILMNCLDSDRRLLVEAVQWWSVLHELHSLGRVPDCYCLPLIADETTDLSFKISCVAQWVGALKYIKEPLRADKNFILSVIEEATAVHSYTDLIAEYKNDGKIISAAAKHSASLLKLASHDLRDDPKFVLSLAKLQPGISYYASDRLSDYLSVCRRDALEVEGLEAIVDIENLGLEIPDKSIDLFKYRDSAILKSELNDSMAHQSNSKKSIKI